MIKLMRATIHDCPQIHDMQVKSFQYLLDKYNDFNTNPAVEPLDRITQKMNQRFTDYHFIQSDVTNIGVIRVVRLDDNICRISPMFILPEYQGNGYAQQAIIEVEKLYPRCNGWQLDTIKEEAKLCHLYEKMGYVKTGKEEKIKENMTIIYYVKSV